MWQGVPSPLAGPLEEDHLSDTGSDEEGDEKDVQEAAFVPTMASAHTFFLQQEAADGAGEEGNATDEASRIVGVASADTADGATAKAEIMRDAQQLRLERDLRELREEMAKLLPQRVETIDDAIVYPRHKLGW